MPNPAPLPADLLDGFRRFRAGRYVVERERYDRLIESGQHPRTMLVACSDSRSGPETVFDALPGELFVVRNVGGLVPVYAPDNRNHAASAALEYAVLALGVRHIVVMGHGRCGGVSAALDDPAPLTSTDFIGSWIQALRDIADEIDPADAADPVRAHRALERRSVEQSLVNLRTFPWIRSRERAGTLSMAGCWFDIGLGELHELTHDGWRSVP
ncbi:MAG TPA: carbonic anhydrase [Candidatus Limnocylindrales bacterium]|nr:carbonic anhydrase [Candidatus Limnocylindrales bacterium]